ncbi:MAG: NAD(P)H-binding protein [Acidimicrobiia bacterium]|nr:NAD(P)H-binding protein [Acidimicrobiia bacterium]
MRIFLAGASGVIGRRVIPLLVDAGHDVVGMTRSGDNAEHLRSLGASPVVCDVFDARELQRAIIACDADLVMHQLTDLPDDPTRLAEYAASNARIRREGTRNLLAAYEAAGAQRFIAQSVAWELPGDSGAAVRVDG